jgi:large subunit ribosomal protein L28
MSKVCSVCGKAPSAGRNVSHSHRVTNRVIRPNIQRVHAVVDGTVKQINVCTKCMKAGKITRGSPTHHPERARGPVEFTPRGRCCVW